MKTTYFGDKQNERIHSQIYYDNLRKSPALKMLIENMTPKEAKQFSKKVGKAFCDALKWMFFPSKRRDIEAKQRG